MDPEEVITSLARFHDLLNMLSTSRRAKEGGSMSKAGHLIVHGPSEAQFSGATNIRAKASGATKAKSLSDWSVGMLAKPVNQQ
jgi:hypothetical protein